METLATSTKTVSLALGPGPGVRVMAPRRVKGRLWEVRGAGVDQRLVSWVPFPGQSVVGEEVRPGVVRVCVWILGVLSLPTAPGTLQWRRAGQERALPCCGPEPCPWL